MLSESAVFPWEVWDSVLDWQEEVVFVLCHRIRVECHFLPVFLGWPPLPNFSRNFSFCVALDLSITPSQPKCCYTLVWPSAIFKAIMDLDLNRLLTDIFLLWTDIFKSLDTLHVSRRPTVGRFLTGCMAWACSDRRLSRAVQQAGLAQAAFLLLHWPQLSLCCSDRILLWAFRPKLTWVLPNQGVEAAGPNPLIFIFLHLEFC